MQRYLQDVLYHVVSRVNPKEQQESVLCFFFKCTLSLVSSANTSKLLLCLWIWLLHISIIRRLLNSPHFMFMATCYLDVYFTGHLVCYSRASQQKCSSYRYVRIEIPSAFTEVMRAMAGSFHACSLLHLPQCAYRNISLFVYTMPSTKRKTKLGSTAA